MSKYSSFKEHQLITENWRKFLNEGLYDAGYETAIKKLNALWNKLRDDGTLRPMTGAELATKAGLQGNEEDLIDELGGLEIGGVFWSQTGEDKFTPNDPSEGAGIETDIGRPNLGATDSAEYLLSQMSIEARADIVRAVREAILGHAPPTEEGVSYVLDRLGSYGDAELEENEEELVPMISSFLADPGAFTELRQKLDLGEVDPDDHAF